MSPASIVAEWDGSTTGKILKVDVTGGENYDFRVFLEGTPSLCSNGHPWAYINESDSNYKTFVGVLLSAKATGSNVTIYTNNDSKVGFCKIGYISVK